MKTAVLTLLLMTTVSGIAFAKDKTDGKSESIAVEKLICSKIYVPATGVASPNYQPGVDVNGNAVAPADISAPAIAMPDYIEVPMTIDLAKKMGSLPTGAEMPMPVANIKLYKDGRVEYNGQDMTSNAVSMCAGTAVSQQAPAAGGQASGQVSGQVSNAAPNAGAPMPLQPQYIAPPVIPDDVTPQAGSVAASSTTPPPKIVYKLQQGTQARYPVDLSK